MQKAVPVGAGAMAALARPRLRDRRRRREGSDGRTAGGDEICEIANDNGGGQVVASGSKAAVEKAIEIAKGHGAKRAMLLPVSAPFHCRLMQPAADAMEARLPSTTICAPIVPLVANVTARPTNDPDEIRKLLVAQVTGTVRWRESVAFMAAQGVTRFVEVGAGKVLTGLLKRIATGAIGRRGRRARRYRSLSREQV